MISARPHRLAEVFAVECFLCRSAVEIPVTGPRHCPNCKVKLDIDWATPASRFAPRVRPADLLNSRAKGEFR